MLRLIQHGNDRFNQGHKGVYHEGSSQSFWVWHLKLGVFGDSFDFFHSSRLNLVAVVLLALAAYACAELILSGALITLYYAGLFVFGIVAVVAIFKNWRTGLYCFVAWILVEDLVRKYLGNNMIIYFAKDFLVLGVYLSFFFERKFTLTKVYKPPFLTIFLVFFSYCLIQACNPASTSIFYGLLGLKLFFLYVPLLPIGYALIDSEKALRRFFFFNSILILVVAAFGIAQSILGHTYLNPEVVQEDIRSMSTLYRISPITGLVAYRPTSFFVSAGRFQDFLTVSWILALGFGGFLIMRKQTGRWLALITVGIIAAASLMTASRSVFLWALLSMIVLALAFVWGATWSGEQRLRAMAAIRRAVVFVAIALTILVAIFPQEVNSRLAIYSETLSPYSPTSELGFRSGNYPLQNFIAAFDRPLWPYGYGIGTASLGGQYVIRIMHAPPMNVGVESGYGQLVVELGIVGLLLWILLTSAITISAWRAVKKLKGTVWFPLAFAICWYAFLLIFPMCFYGLDDYQDFLMNAYFWLALGILFKLSEFPRNLQTTQTITRAR